MKTIETLELHLRLLQRRELLEARLARIHANLTRPLDRDSKERAKEMEDCEVVDALGIDATEELGLIRATLGRIDEGEYGACNCCGRPIGAERLQAWPYASRCIDCARDDERLALRA